MFAFADPSKPTTRLASARRWLVRAAVALGVLAALIALAWLVVPYVVRAQVETRLTEALHRKTTVERVEFNPFTLRLTLHNVAVEGLFSADAIDANVSSASLWHWAPVFDALRLAHPSVSLSRDASGRYSVQDLVDAAGAAPEGPTPV